MDQSDENHHAGLLRNQIRTAPRWNHRGEKRVTIVPIDGHLTFDKGLFMFIRALQLLRQNFDGIIVVGLAGPSGAGKTVFSNKVRAFLPGCAMLQMDMYNDGTKVVDDNFDDPRLTDYDTLLQNIQGLVTGESVECPIYDFKTSKRVGYQTIPPPVSRVVVVEGIYALSTKLRDLLDLRVSIKGGVHFDLVKRVLRDIDRSGQDPEAILQQISSTVYPMYKIHIEPDLETAHLQIVNHFNPFSGLQNATYTLKSDKEVNEEDVLALYKSYDVECTIKSQETMDIYLLPPNEDPETCQTWLRMRSRDGKYSLMFEEFVTDDQFIISPRICFEVSVRVMGGLMALGYTMKVVMKRSSRVFEHENFTVKIDYIEGLDHKYTQVQGKNREVVAKAGTQLGLDGSYTPHSYIEQVQLQHLTNEFNEATRDLKHRLHLDSVPNGDVLGGNRPQRISQTGSTKPFTPGDRRLASMSQDSIANEIALELEGVSNIYEPRQGGGGSQGGHGGSQGGHGGSQGGHDHRQGGYDPRLQGYNSGYRTPTPGGYPDPPLSKPSAEMSELKGQVNDAVERYKQLADTMQKLAANMQMPPPPPPPRMDLLPIGCVALGAAFGMSMMCVSLLMNRRT